jgi:hypothetical protein
VAPDPDSDVHSLFLLRPDGGEPLQLTRGIEVRGPSPEFTAAAVELAERVGSSTSLHTLRAALRLTVNTVCSGDTVSAEVVVANVGVGHLLPTGPAGRQLVTEVAARSFDGSPLRLRSGPRLAPCFGSGPGRVFASSKDAPVSAAGGAPFAPFATDVSEYRFTAPDGEPVQVTARLVLVPLDGDPDEIASASASCHSTGGNAVMPRTSDRQASRPSMRGSRRSLSSDRKYWWAQIVRGKHPDWRHRCGDWCIGEALYL